ncbi:outer membrane beta-barrel protein [Psychroserpens sp. SPM9]|uniref:outer membrane beta-barrel protein n=1 Tax=Psychroserpens sp. SPM9 TaxID=2975598 RepID=UPI0021A479AD|nr:outer membrane beta-barrel protein [Psychroserpens sp. SPM9]MDG5490333.1 outer membrane beta-barrel protein [Psychroserpens sp. SPM9]
MSSWHKINLYNDMTSNYRLQKWSILVIALVCFVNTYAQKDTNKWKAQISLGVNSPSQSGFVEGFQAKSVNFPTVNLGLQHMFKSQLGAKLDFGFNRFSSDDNSVEFKTNYTRLNAQLVYDPTESISFLPQRMGFVLHAGPGYSFVKPLGNFGGNKISFFNVMGGFELHYGLTQEISVFADTSYIIGFGKDFDPETEGFGSFNGNLLTVSFGVTFSISGCQYCD